MNQTMSMKVTSIAKNLFYRKSKWIVPPLHTEPRKRGSGLGPMHASLCLVILYTDIDGNGNQYYVGIFDIQIVVIWR